MANEYEVYITNKGRYTVFDIANMPPYGDIDASKVDGGSDLERMNGEEVKGE